MDVGELQSNIANVYRSIDAARERRAQKTGAMSPVCVVAATKTIPPEGVNALIACGINRVGENRVQEYIAKRDGVRGAEWHFIGTLQRNKAKYLVGSVALIQSVSSLALAAEIDRLARARGIVQDVLIEVNAADEPDKTGAPTAQADELIDGAKKLPGLNVRGLMSVPPIGADDLIYERLYGIFAAHADDRFDILSVGMSGDHVKAIEHGSNMVRIGTAFFGSRTGREQYGRR